MPLNKKYIRDAPANIDYNRQAIQVPGTKRPGQSAHYRSAVFDFLDLNTPNTTKTVDAIFLSGLEAGANRDFLGHRPVVSKNPLKFADHYVWITYGDVDIKRRQLGSALNHLFNNGTLGGGDHRTVGLWSQNRPEWQIVDITCQSYQLTSVSLYDTLGKDAVEYIVKHAHTTVVFATADHIPLLLKSKPNLPMLKLIVCIDDITPEALDVLLHWSDTFKVQLKTLNDMYELGKAHLREPIPAKPEDLSSISYTSGTTGNPKGVMLTHSMLALAVNSSAFGFDLPDEGTMISYLPLAHIYGRIVELGCMMVSARMGYFTGNPLRLLEDIQVLKPHFFPAVPRVLNKVYQSAMAAAELPGIKGLLFKKAVATKLENLRTTGATTHMLWDRLVFKKVQAALGGQVVVISTGSAPVSTNVLAFLKIALLCRIEEGYGLTETCATATKTFPYDPLAPGTVGPPQPVSEVKLLDVPSMGYTSEDKPNPRGEICVRGCNVFTQYYKDPENTKKAIGDEGFLKTGDIAEVDSAGRFKIIDRVKNIMKLAQGEYVALEKIENSYAGAALISQILVHGDSLESFVLGVVVPDPVQLSVLVAQITGEKVAPEDQVSLQKWCGDQRIIQGILNVLDKEAKRQGLKGFEMVKRIHVTMNPFSVEDNTLTPTLKIKRKEAAQKFAKELKALYALGDPKL